MTHFLEIKYHATNSQYAFPDKESAERVMNDLMPKIGKDFLGRNQEDDATHKFLFSHGEAVVVCSKVESVSVCNLDSIRAERSSQQDIDDQDYIRRRRIIKSALRDEHSVPERSEV